MEDTQISQATVIVSNEGLLLTGPSLGSCKFKNESYVCMALSINHPSHHTIEGVQSDGEVVAYFKKPTGERLCVSALFRVSTAQNSSYTFFKQFVPYGLTTGDTKLQLRDWSLTMMCPPGSPYFVYTGSTLVPPCVSTEWVVFKNTITMDTGDFAYLVRNVGAGSRSVQSIGDREVFFNDTRNTNGAMPHDNKFYLRLKPTGNTKIDKKKSNPVDLESNVVDPPLSQDEYVKYAYEAVEENGGWVKTLIIVLTVLAVVYGLRLGWVNATDSPYKAIYAFNFANWIRDKLKAAYDYIGTVVALFTPRVFKRLVALKTASQYRPVSTPLPPPEQKVSV